MTKTLTHLNDQGEAHMVDVSEKTVTHRAAIAHSFVVMQSETLAMITEGKHKKGDVFAVARIAGIQAAKKCAELVPLCHPLNLTHISVEISAEPDNKRVKIEARCALDAKTGVEMEALTAASVSALTIYDMCKAVDKGMIISETKLIEKTGGRSGEWKRQD